VHGAEHLSFSLAGSDPAGQWKWLQQTLASARSASEKVWIIAHIPPGDGEAVEVGESARCDTANERVADSAAELHGRVPGAHQRVQGHRGVPVLWPHASRPGTNQNDECADLFLKALQQQVAMLRDSTGPTSALMIAPSVTTQGAINPSYRLFHYNTATFEVTGYDSYCANLTEANLAGALTFRRLYNSQTDLGLASLTPAAYEEWLQLLQHNDTAFNTFYSEYFSAGGPIGPCTGACKTQFLCESLYVVKEDRLQCIANAKSM
jgi:sphingomyelin phosphodiesterase